MRSRRSASAASTLVVCAVAFPLLSGCTRSTVADPSLERAVSSPAPNDAPNDAERSEVDRAAATLALQDAVEAGDLDGASAAIARGADLEVRDGDGRTPLVVATKSRQTAIALRLLEAGADPNAQDDMRDSAFLYSGAEGLDQILTATLEHGADVASTNRFGGTALIPASEHAHVSTVEILIAAGVPLDHVNNLGWTALHEAIVLGTGSADHVRVVRALLDAGADPTLPDGNGVAPRDLAISHGYANIVAEFDRADRG